MEERTHREKANQQQDERAMRAKTNKKEEALSHDATQRKDTSETPTHALDESEPEWMRKSHLNSMD